MSNRSRWETADFDEMSWRDVSVHALRIVENDPKTGAAELILDVDYIVEWRCGVGSNDFSFLVAQAILQFHSVTDLQIAVDYATQTIAVGAFTIHEIRRERITYRTGYSSFSWDIALNSPDGRLAFKSPGFTQYLVGDIVESKMQSLHPQQRSGRI